MMPLCRSIRVVSITRTLSCIFTMMFTVYLLLVWFVGV